MKESITGSEALMRSLEHEGVKTIFGYPGGAIMPVYDALFDHKDSLNHILVRHEQGAAHAAQGYARVSGEVGVCLVTSGPGATNTITGVADAMIDSTPMVVIAGSRFFGNGRFPRGGLGRCHTAHLKMELSNTKGRRHSVGGFPCFLYCTKRSSGSRGFGLRQECAAGEGGI